jgi:hypothetical protein
VGLQQCCAFWGRSPSAIHRDWWVYFRALSCINMVSRSVSVATFELFIIGLFCVKRHANGMGPRRVPALHFAGNVLKGLYWRDISFAVECGRLTPLDSFQGLSDVLILIFIIIIIIKLGLNQARITISFTAELVVLFSEVLSKGL